MDPFIGEVRLFSFERIPTGWLACQGQILQIRSYQALYALVGTYYGGDGQTTFALPDLRGRVPIHVGTSPSGVVYSMGNQVGQETVTLSATQLPAHTHLIAVSNTAGTTATAAATLYLGAIAPPTTPANPPAAPNLFAAPGMTGQTTTFLQAGMRCGSVAIFLPEGVSTAGGSGAHENRQPYLVMNYCIAVSGLFPVRG